jgi:YVTN family beta-propeller protein
MNGLKFYPSVRRAPLICLLVAAMACVLAASGRQGSQSTNEIVGRLGENRFYTPVNQILTPAGLQVDLPDLRPHALALSPDAGLLVVAGATHELLAVDPANGVIREHVYLPSDLQKIPSPDEDKLGQISYTGLAFSPDGSRIFLSNVKGSVEVFTVNRAGHIAGLFSITLPPVPGLKRTEEIPSGIAISADGKKLYVCGNLSNRLLELDAGSGAVLRTWNVGVAPYEVVLVGGKAFVSNWGGRRPDTGSITGPAGQGSRVRVDAVRHIAVEGSVSIVDLAAGVTGGNGATDLKEIPVGLHPSALVLTPDRRYVVVANAGSDTLSVIDTRTGKIIETICTRHDPADLFGAQPNALTFDKTGGRLFVCNGTQNAVAVIDFKPGKSKLAGLIPTGWFPGAIAYDGGRHALYVANIKGLSPGRPRKSNGKTEYNSRMFDGSLSLIQEPSARELAGYTRMAMANMRYLLLKQAALPPRPGQPPRPVPERAGEPSVFQHVVYIIKENRSYDQVLGDVKEGNGDPELCVFGENITPNQHKMVRDFVLLDNTYCSGILSADGHQWADSGIVTDYLEKSFSEFPRSYPDGMEDTDVDALAYSPAGFIWDDALSHGRTLRDYGEFAITRKRWKDPQRRGEPRFLDHYREFLNGTDTIALWSEPGIESLRPYMDTDTVGWDLNVPDVFRAAQFVKELREFERTGSFPNLAIICLPDDHTSGTKAGSPTPAAQVADNDLAFGQIVEALSHSRFWRETCIFAIEDDPQAGWDHVSGYRTTAYVLSAYTQRKKVVHTQYNQTSLLRTIELILGLPPMNQLDATATPMSDCFMDAPDMTPFVSLKNNVPLDQLNPRPERISDPTLRRDAIISARLPLVRADQCPEDTLNRILWHAMRGTKLPYPLWAVQAVDDDKRHD